MSVLDIHAERFAASGAMAADGMRKLLGTPALTLIQTVLREAVQNSWDARLPDGQLEFWISLRHLDPEECKALRTNVFAQLPPHGTSSAPIRRMLAESHPVVMELSDWGGRGLGGPTRADIVPARGESNDFVNFVRNMGARRDIDSGGGTYGYGKTSLYSMSRCSTILIDSLAAEVSGGSLRRFIGCHLGEAHDIKRSVRLTGRHWWGRQIDEQELVEPLLGREAAAAAAAIGMPDRHAGDTGTTLMILDPEIGERELQDVAAEIQETLLWFLWPKMLSGAQGPAIRFRLRVDGEEIPIPTPESFPPLDLLVEAYRAVKSGHDVQEIWSERPIQLLGHCAIRRGFRGQRKLVMEPRDSIIPHTASHIALMRPVELVVKYIEGTALPSEAHEWAGVFICSEKQEVEQAFADAEPPAHDDWIPDKMPKGWAKTYVRVTLSRLRQLASSYAYPDLELDENVSTQPSLARAADRLGKLIPFGVRSNLGAKALPAGLAGGGGGGGTAQKRWHVSDPRFVLLEEGTGGGEAVFEVEIANRTSSNLRVTALPSVVIDGSLAGKDDAGDIVVPLLGWEETDGTPVQSAATISVAKGTYKTFRLRVGVPSETAVGISFDISDAGIA